MSSRRRLLWLAAGFLLALVSAAGLVIFNLERGPDEAEIIRLANAIELRPGMTVADVGAGDGTVAIALARRVGPAGRVYATEIDAEMLAKIRDAAAAANLINVMVITAGERSTNLPDACCDAIYMRRVYHHLSDSADTVQGVHRALRPGGRFAVVDFLSPWWLFFIHHGVSADAVVPQVTAAGFAVERRIDRWSLVDYCIVFRKTE